MLTPLTQTALAVLNDIAYGDSFLHASVYAPCACNLSALLCQLQSAGLIRLLAHKEPGCIASYELTRAAIDISLLDVLEATDEHLNCNHETREEMYAHYGYAARKLGIVNQITRTYLSEIKLTEL